MSAARKSDRPASSAPPARRAVVVGLGQTGLSCVRYLAARGCAVAVVDTRAQPPKLDELRREFPAVALHTGKLDSAWFEDADMLVVSPGIAISEPAIAGAQRRGVEVVGDVELFAQAVEGRAPVIAITGANGKSTVTSLVGAMCRAAGLDTRVGGNIGVPVLSLLDQALPQVYVLELSSFQLETTRSLAPRAATILNLTADHMDRYRDLDEYAAAKARIYLGAQLAVINRDDPASARLAPPDVRMTRFGLDRPEREIDYGLVERDGEAWFARGSAPLFPTQLLPLPGRHNVANALAAMALAESVGVDVAAMQRAITEFKGLAHRTVVVAQRDGVRWIDDSKGTNVGATIAALEGMGAPVVLIAGGDGKGQDFAPLRSAVERHARAVVLIGRDAPLIEAAVSGVVPVLHGRDMDDAVQRAASVARAGDVVLLSPACASFDMFKNYEHRGDVFAHAVRRRLA